MIGIFFSMEGFGQEDLVPNGNFEQYFGCPTNFAQIDSLLYWMNPTAYLIGTPDYYNRCNTTNVSIPNNNFGYQETHSGNGYCGLIIDYPTIANYREYIEVQLLSEMNAGRCYHISMFINLSNSSKLSSKDISAYFSDTIIQGVNNYLPLSFIPQFTYNGTLYPDTLNWTLVDGDVMANGGEKYLIIGNFDYDYATDTIFTNSAGHHFQVYLYVDDVSLFENDLSDIIAHDTIISQRDSVFLGSQSDLLNNENYIWFLNGVAIDTSSGIWVKPDTTTTYVLQQTICGGVKYDTVTVIIKGDGIGEFGIGKKLRVYPNPAVDEFYIEYSGYDTGEGMVMEVYNIYGSLVKEVHVNNRSKIIISTRDMPSGIYYYQVKLGNNVVGKDKIVIMK